MGAAVHPLCTKPTSGSAACTLRTANTASMLSTVAAPAAPMAWQHARLRTASHSAKHMTSSTPQKPCNSCQWCCTQPASWSRIPTCLRYPDPARIRESYAYTCTGATPSCGALHLHPLQGGGRHTHSPAASPIHNSLQSSLEPPQSSSSMHSSVLAQQQQPPQHAANSHKNTAAAAAAKALHQPHLISWWRPSWCAAACGRCRCLPARRWLPGRLCLRLALHPCR